MKSLLLAACAALLTHPALAHDGVRVTEAYVRAMGMGSGAAFLWLENHADDPDRLIGATADRAGRAELHTVITDAQGMTAMVPLADGIPLLPYESHELARGGDHIMLFDLEPGLAEGDIVVLTLTFESSDPVVVEAVVDNHRPAGGGHGAQGAGH